MDSIKSNSITQKGFGKLSIIFFIFLLLGVGGIYFFTPFFKGEKKETRYVLAEVKKGMITSSVSGSGQVSSSNQIDVKPKVSGDLVALQIQKGQQVAQGDILARINNSDVKKSLRDAELQLKSALVSLEKLKKPADEYALLQARNALVQAQREYEDLQKPPDSLVLLQAENSLIQSGEAKKNAENNLKKAYEDGFNLMSSVFLDLPGIISGLNDMLFDNTIDRSQWNIGWYANQASKWEETKVLSQKVEVTKRYEDARKKYDIVFEKYRLASRSSDITTQESLILETYDVVLLISDAVKAANNYIDFIQDVMQQHELTIPAQVSTHQGLLDTYTSKINPHASNLFSIKHTIQTQKDALVSSDRSIAEKAESLEKIKRGPEKITLENAQDRILERQEALVKLQKGTEKLDIQSQELAIKQKQHAVLDLQEKLKEYALTAPFDGVISNVAVKKTDSVSPQTILATLMTKTRIAEITLNEVDQVKVQQGQKAMLTFDALPVLSISGKVVEIDTVGTVSQGVVSYTIKIGFDTDDQRIKSGMSVSASIITDVRTDVFILPGSAIKSQREQYYVELVQDAPVNSIGVLEGVTLEKEPVRRTIEVGIASEDAQEIRSGLVEGDVVVVSKINSAAQSQIRSTQQPAFRVPGVPGGGGGGRGNFGGGNNQQQR